LSSVRKFNLSGSQFLIEPISLFNNCFISSHSKDVFYKEFKIENPKNILIADDKQQLLSINLNRNNIKISNSNSKTKNYICNEKITNIKIYFDHSIIEVCINSSK